MTDSLNTQTLPDRLNRLQELTEFTENCKKQLNQLFDSLGWKQDDGPRPLQELMEQCPYDPSHRVPVRSMERHKAICNLNQLGYSQEEQAEMYDPTVHYENTNISTFTMDKSTQQQIILQARAAAPLMRMEGVFWQVTGVSIREELGSMSVQLLWFRLALLRAVSFNTISFQKEGQYSSQPIEVPQNHKRAICDLTVADRLALFDHVTSQQRDQTTSANNEDLYVDLVAKLKRDEQQNEPKSHLELLAEMRDYKRRRQSYRAKNVHITKKSYTEVIREVIDVHSGELSRQWREEEREEEAARRAMHSSQRRRSDDGRSSSTESAQCHSRERHGSHSRRHHSREHSEVKESKKKKKRKKRDSRSPDDRHHDRKKKKKRGDRE